MTFKVDIALPILVVVLKLASIISFKLSLTFSPIFYLNISNDLSQMKLGSVGTPEYSTFS
jgi:hypothetical protein